MNAIVGRTLKGQTKTLTIEKDAVTFAYRVLYHGFKGDKRIPFSSITAVQFREPGNWIAGYIQFSIKGSVEWMGQVNQDENAAQFDTSELADFIALRDLVQERIAAHSSPMQQISAADELAKLAALRDQGILTDEEFVKQKTKLLE